MSYIHNPKTILVSLDRKVKITRGVNVHGGHVFSVSLNIGKSWMFLYRGDDQAAAMRSFNNQAKRA